MKIYSGMQIFENVYGWSYRMIHMVIIAMYHLIFGFAFAVLNNYMFYSVETIREKYDKDNTTLYFEIIGWIILETIIVVAEIYLVRNIVKRIMATFHRITPNRKLSINKRNRLIELARNEESNNIMIGYTVYLFNVNLNEKYAFLMSSITKREHDV